MWRIDSIPYVELGTLEGSDGQDLARPWASLRLSDGTIAVSNAQTNELRLYSPDGDFLHAAGGSGAGPGEFTRIGRLARTIGDTIVASDTRVPRLSLFGPTGAFGRTVALETVNGRSPRLRGLMHDTVGVYVATRFGNPDARQGKARDTVIVAMRDLDGSPSRIVGSFPAQEKFDQIMSNGGISMWELPFGRDAHVAVSRDLVWVGVSDSYELRGYDATGTLTRLFRVDEPVVASEQGQRDRWFEHQLGGVENATLRRMYLDVRDVMEFSPNLPSFAGLMTDADGHVWVQDYALPWEAGPTLWRVFDRDGRAVAQARMPRGLVPHEIGQDYVMGLWIDDLGVEHIRVHALERTDEVP